MHACSQQYSYKRSARRTDAAENLHPWLHTTSKHTMDLSTAELLRKSDALTSKLKTGTSTKEDKEEFVKVTAAIECSSLDTATLLSKSAAIADKLKTGTATKEDKLRSAVRHSSHRSPGLHARSFTPAASLVAGAPRRGQAPEGGGRRDP